MIAPTMLIAKHKGENNLRSHFENIYFKFLVLYKIGYSNNY